MKLLSPKNKTLMFKVLGWFGAIVLGLIFFRNFKDNSEGNDTPKEKLANVVEDVKDLFKFSVVAIGLMYIQQYFATDGVYQAVLLGTLTTGAAVVTTFNTTYLPKYFTYAAATQLTGVKITVQGDGVIFDSDAAGLNHKGVLRVLGQVTNNYFFTISNGFVAGKNVIWEFTNSAAQTPAVYVASDETPATGAPMYLQLLRQAILAGSGQNFEKLASISFPSLAATDVVNVLYDDGTQQQLNRIDIQTQLGNTQNVVNTPIYTMDNIAGRIKTVNVIAGANQTAYIQRWVAAMGDAMINQVVNN